VVKLKKIRGRKETGLNLPYRRKVKNSIRGHKKGGRGGGWGRLTRISARSEGKGGSEKLQEKFWPYSQKRGGGRIG